MSTSLMYHAFGVRGYRYVRTEYIKGGAMFAMECNSMAFCWRTGSSASKEYTSTLVSIAFIKIAPYELLAASVNRPLAQPWL